MFSSVVGETLRPSTTLPIPADSEINKQINKKNVMTRLLATKQKWFSLIIILKLILCVCFVAGLVVICATNHYHVCNYCRDYTVRQITHTANLQYQIQAWM